MTLAHDSWAEIYDRVYAESFGSLYDELLRVTLREVARLAVPGARIVDFGAGTGRLSIPLSRAGFAVTAVDPSNAMLERIRASDMADRIRCELATMQDYRAHASHDLALCVFTVVIYLLDKPALRAAFESARKALADGGRMLLDIPPRALFASQSFVTGSMQRTVSVTGLGHSRYAYAEDITLNDSDGARRFSDAFTIRFWPVATVLSVARECGFEVEADLSGRFALSGSNYYLLQRA